MFDLGFIEMLVVGIIALLVLGPERLPGAVRTVGLTVGRIKRSFADVRSQVEREIGADEIRQQLHNERIMATLEKEKKPPEPTTDSDGNKAVTQDEQTSSASETTPDVPPAPAPAETPEDDIPKRTHER